jgi:hypothetical protein
VPSVEKTLKNYFSLGMSVTIPDDDLTNVVVDLS